MDGYVTTERHKRRREEVRTFAETDVVSRMPDVEASRSVQHELSWLIAPQGPARAVEYGDPVERSARGGPPAPWSSALPGVVTG